MPSMRTTTTTTSTTTTTTSTTHSSTGSAAARSVTSSYSGVSYSSALSRHTWLSTTTTSSTISAPPAVSRPFHKASKTRQILGRNNNNSKKYNKLAVLVVRREWQKVLIRSTRIPQEVLQPILVDLLQQHYHARVLHLCLALQPPAKVVHTILSVYNTTSMSTTTTTTGGRRKRTSNTTTSTTSSTTTNPSHVFMMRKQHTKQHTALKQFFFFFGNKKRRKSIPQTTKRIVSPEKDDKKPITSSVRNKSTTRFETSFRNTPSTIQEEEEVDDEVDDKSYGDMQDDYDDTQHERDDYVPMRHRGGLCTVQTSIAPDEEEEEEEEMEDFVMERTQGEAAIGAVESFSSSSSSSSLSVALEATGVVVNRAADELSSSGAMPQSNGPLLSETTPSITHQQWDLDALLEQADSLFPIHVACLYRASPEVLQLLLEANPQSTSVMAMGLLPIHMVCAGLDLPPPVEAPPSIFPMPELEEDEYKLAETIYVLAQHDPSTLVTRSKIHGMTPLEYIEETLEDGEYKQLCFSVLEEAGWQARVQERYHSVNSTASSSGSPEDWMRYDRYIPSEIMCDSTIPSHDGEEDDKVIIVPELRTRRGRSPLYSLMLSKDWALVFQVIEQDPEQACEWQYGIEMDQFGDSDEPRLYKRLPIHFACTMHAPVEVLEALFQAYPKGLTSEDPYTGDLPLHLACRSEAPAELVESLLVAHPRATRQIDKNGRLPLHWACLAGSTLSTIQSLIKAYPHSSSVVDNKKYTPLDYARQNTELDESTVVFLSSICRILDREIQRSESALAAIAEESTSQEPSLCDDSSVESVCEMLRGI